MTDEKFDLAAQGSRAIERRADELSSTLEGQIADFLLDEIREGYADRQADAWDRDYESIEAYLDSIEPNRRKWRESMGAFPEPTSDFRPNEVTVLQDGDVEAKRLSVRMYDDYELRARGILGLPEEEGPHPLVICQHGAGSSPEKTFGYADSGEAYHAYARRLVENGYAVFSPRVMRGANPLRGTYETICHAYGASLFGLDTYMLEQVLDYLETRPEIGGRIAMWGISQGGTSTVFQVPVIDRIDVAISTAWFNDRLRKHLLIGRDPRHHNPDEINYHFYVHNWLREFKTADLVSLICPRPFQAQTGKHDDISWYPHVREEYAEASGHYARLGIEERVELDDHDGGHEIDFEAGLRFLDEHL